MVVTDKQRAAFRRHQDRMAARYKKWHEASIEDQAWIDQITTLIETELVAKFGNEDTEKRFEARINLRLDLEAVHKAYDNRSITE